MTRNVMKLGMCCGVLSLGALAVAGHASGALAGGGEPPSAGARVSASALRHPTLTTPAQRAADRTRRTLLGNAHRTAVPIGWTRKKYLDVMRAIWVQDLDANQDGAVSWQTGPESLGAQINQCVVVQYVKQPAKKEKDKTKPGTWIETPEQWVPTDWLTWPEVLSTTHVKGDCETIGVVDEAICRGKDGKPLPKQGGLPIGLPKMPCYNSWGMPTSCPVDPDAAKKSCEARGGTYEVHTKMQGCEVYRDFGPDSMPAFLAVAGQNFDSEDHNHNGVIGQGEGAYLCLK